MLSQFAQQGTQPGEHLRQEVALADGLECGLADQECPFCDAGVWLGDEALELAEQVVVEVDEVLVVGFTGLEDQEQTLEH